MKDTLVVTVQMRELYTFILSLVIKRMDISNHHQDPVFFRQPGLLMEVLFSSPEVVPGLTWEASFIAGSISSPFFSCSQE